MNQLLLINDNSDYGLLIFGSIGLTVSVFIVLNMIRTNSQGSIVSVNSESRSEINQASDSCADWILEEASQQLQQMPNPYSFPISLHPRVDFLNYFNSQNSLYYLGTINDSNLPLSCQALIDPNNLRCINIIKHPLDWDPDLLYTYSKYLIHSLSFEKAFSLLNSVTENNLIGSHVVYLYFIILSSMRFLVISDLCTYHWEFFELQEGDPQKVAGIIKTRIAILHAFAIQCLLLVGFLDCTPEFMGLGGFRHASFIFGDISVRVEDMISQLKDEALF